jgi:DNA repair ATPase RecN
MARQGPAGTAIRADLHWLPLPPWRIPSRTSQRLDALAADHRDLVTAVHRIDERLSRVEKRLDDLLASPPRYALESDVRNLRTRLDAVAAQLEALRRRLET